MAYDIDWNPMFPSVYGVMYLKESTILYRGYQTEYPPVSSYPSYYSSKNIADRYAKKHGRKLGTFITTRTLKIIDIRFMKVLLRDLFETYPEINDSILSTILSFGLCSRKHQLELIKTRYKHTDVFSSEIKAVSDSIDTNPLVEQSGIRVAETTNDGQVMAFLKQFFIGFADGFVAPALQSPFHSKQSGYMHPELIIFDPAFCKIQLIEKIPKLIPISLADVFDMSAFTVTTLSANSKEVSFALRGGTKHVPKHLPSIEAFSELLCSGDAEAHAAYTKGSDEGHLLHTTHGGYSKYYRIPSEAGVSSWFR